MHHSSLEELIPLYAVDGLPREQATRVEQHLAECSACRALLSEYRLVADGLLEQVPVQIAHARVGVWLQNKTRENGRRSVSLSTPITMPQPPHVWKHGLGVPRWVLAVSGAVVALLILIAVFSVFQMTRPVPTASGDLNLLLDAPGRRTVALVGSESAPAARGELMWAARSRVCYLWIDGLTPLAPDLAYQIWLRHDGERASAGLFNVDAEGRAMIVFNAPDALSEYSEIGITVEPARGSPAPTTARVIGASFD